MKVKTIFPIIIQGNQTRASVGASARVVRRKRPLRRGVKIVHFDGDNAMSFNGCDGYEPQDEWNFNFDGKKATSAQLADFQKFANSNGFTPQLTVDGKYGANTQKAITALGAKYDAYVKFRDDDSGGSVVNAPAAATPPLVDPNAKPSAATTPAADAAKATDKKSLKDKIKGMSTGMKIGIAVGGVAIIGLIIFAATRKRN